MRAAQKSQAEEFVRLLEQVHQEIKNYIDAEAFSAALDLLAQCQQGAMELGNMIECIEGENCKTIRILETYCEQLYVLHTAITEKHLAEAVNADKRLHKLLQQTEHSIKYDIRLHREVVFLPYKASMWDSLESVWMAADEDPECDAYVIPIPYYDRKPDGSFGEMHDEGNNYPDYVPVVDYHSYSFEKRQPDMIFIHNPYDDCNYVTSVHPDFYSNRLKQYTKQLVYIPYFVLGEVDADNERSLESIEHFCSVPGVINADTVIVQSREMRRAYVKIMMRLSGNGGADRKYWESKILGLGSPKMDRVARIRKEDVDIPESWLRLISKPDGSRKKIILYNTSVVALLKHEEKMLDKIKDVLWIMKENQEETVLLWRPHPLMKATMESMRPQLWRKYEKVVKEYRLAGFGIFDDTADIERAIALSDAYYGDMSSVVHMYRETGKPVMIQDVEVRRDGEEALQAQISL